MSDNTKLNSLLEEGETLLWSGVPQSYSLFDESHKKSTIITICWALAWGIFLVGGYYSLAVSKGIEIREGVMLFCIAVPAFIVWMAVSDRKRVKQLKYAVTDKRAIVLSDKPIVMHAADIDDIRIDKADNGNCHIRVGAPACKASPRKLPVLAYRGEYKDHGNDKIYTGLVFFNVSAEDEKIINNLLRPAASSAAA